MNKQQNVSFLRFIQILFKNMFSGNAAYYTLLSILFVICLIGLNAYIHQLVHGLATTGMTNNIIWGLYVANFIFIVGLAATSIVLLIPFYIYKQPIEKEAVILGELWAISSLIMCFLFVKVCFSMQDVFLPLEEKKASAITSQSVCIDNFEKK